MMKLAPTPGEHLKVVLQEKEMKNAELATRMGRSPQYVTDIIKGKKVMDVDLAIELDRALDGHTSAARWLEIAIEHRLQSQQPTRPDVIAKYPYAKDLIKLKWVDGSQSPIDLDQELQEFWALADRAANFKTSPASAINELGKKAWAIQVYRLANDPANLPLPAYDEAKLPQLHQELKRLMRDPSSVTQIKPLLEKYGIRVIYLPNPKGCAVDGIASYNDGKPYLGMSLRIARFDSVCFTLWHELNHIEHKDSEHGRVSPDVIDAPAADNEIETRANTEAGEHILSEEAYADFILRGNYTFKAIEAEAATHKIHVSILLGRMKRDHLLDWSQFAREHPGVRDVLLASTAI